jgi:hypothetical protein
MRSPAQPLARDRAWMLCGALVSGHDRSLEWGDSIARATGTWLNAFLNLNSKEESRNDDLRRNLSRETARGCCVELLPWVRTGRSSGHCGCTEVLALPACPKG